jgi:hypothetical protein
MGRFFRIEIGTSPENAPNPAGGASNISTSSAPAPTIGFTTTTAVDTTNNNSALFTNQINGKNDPRALRIEWNIPVAPGASPYGQGTFKIWGVSLQQVFQAQNFNGQPVRIFGGMQPGLPLATSCYNDGQQGLLVEGYILQCFGNWMGINQTLDFVISTDGSSIDTGQQASPGNFTFSWKKGTKLADALQQTLSIAYPNQKLNINISDQLVLPSDETGAFGTFSQFAFMVKSISIGVLSSAPTPTPAPNPGGAGPGAPASGTSTAPDSYAGVDMVWDVDQITVFDSTSQSTPKQLRFIDLIGQITWLGPSQIQFNTVMRADLSVGDYVSFPQLAGIQSVTAPNNLGTWAKDSATFSGAWQINSILHVADSRAPDTMSWITSFQASSQKSLGGFTPAQAATNPKATSA